MWTDSEDRYIYRKIVPVVRLGWLAGLYVHVLLYTMYHVQVPLGTSKVPLKYCRSSIQVYTFEVPLQYRTFTIPFTVPLPFGNITFFSLF